MDNYIRVRLELDTKKAYRQLSDFKSEYEEIQDVADMGASSETSDETAEAIRRNSEAMEQAKADIAEYEAELSKLNELYADFYAKGENDKYVFTDEEALQYENVKARIEEINTAVDEKNGMLKDSEALEKRLLDLLRLQVQEEKNANDEVDKGASGLQSHGKGMSGLLRTLKRYGMAMLGIRGAFTAVRKAMSSYLSANEDTAKRMQTLWSALGSFLGPLLDWISQKLAMVASYINLFVKYLTGVDFVARQNAKSLNKQAQAQAKLQRQSASFDEQNKLSDTSSGSGSSGAGAIDLPEVPADTAEKIKAVATALKPLYDLIVGIGKFILDNWQAVLLAILAFNIVKWIRDIGTLGAVLKGFADFFLGNWVALLIAGIVFLVTYIVTHFEEVKEFLSNLWTNIKKIVATGWEAIKAIVSGIGQFVLYWIGGVLENIKNTVKAVVGFFVQMWEDIKMTFLIMVAGVVSFFTTIYEKIVTFCTNAFAKVKSWFDTIRDWLSAKALAVSGVFEKIWEGIKGVFSNVVSWFKNVFSNAWEAVKSVFSGDSNIFKGIKEGISSVFKSIVNKLIGGLNAVIAFPLNKINGMLNTIKEFSILGMTPFYNAWGYNPIKVPQIPMLAQGGIAVRPTSAIIGEAGKEAVLPLENNTDWMDVLADKIATNITIEALPLNVDGKKIAQIVFKNKAQMQFVNNRGY